MNSSYSSESYVTKPIVCCNCGGVGHLYRQCNHPITSFGCIAIRLQYDAITNTMFPEYLMVQRKDSLAYVEFLRGKYNLQNVTYLSTLLSNMTPDERGKILSKSFEELWKELWSHSCRVFAKEFAVARDKFNMLKNGYLLRTKDGPIKRIDVSHIYAQLKRTLHETEWGFPKGRRNFYEDDKRCALREFKEETGINLAHIRILRDMKPVEEVFSGTNHMRYKHVYYLAKLVANTNAIFDPNNKHQVREIKDVKWFCYHDAQAKINDAYIERKELLKRVNALVMKSNLNFL